MMNLNKLDFRASKSPLLWIVFFVLLLIEFALVVKLFGVPENMGALLTAIVTMAVILVLMLRLPDIVELNIGTLKAKLIGFEDQLGKVDKRVETLARNVYELFLLSMDKKMYKNLKKIVDGDFHDYENLRKGSPLDRELRDLRSRGYIELTSNTPALGSIPETGNNLMKYVKATEEGKRFVKLRELMDEIEKTGSQG